MKSAFKAIEYLCVFFAIFFLIIAMTEISTLIESRDSIFLDTDGPTLGSFLSKYWPNQVLITLVGFAFYIALLSNKTKALIANINISGNILIPILISIYVLVVVGYILSSDISYPSRFADPKLTPVTFLASGSLLFIPFLFCINEYLPRPSSIATFTATIILMFGASFWALLTWLHYIVSGDIDLVHGFTLLF